MELWTASSRNEELFTVLASSRLRRPKQGIGAAIGFITSEPIPLAHRIGIRLARTALTSVYAAFFDCCALTLAHRALCAAAILRRAAADNVRLGEDFACGLLA